jgi:large subunit ribosomal protein L13
MKTFIPKVDPTGRKWLLVDLDGQIMGRAAVKIARILTGKTKPIFTPHLDTGDSVIAINAARLKFSGKQKPSQLKYYNYSGYPGGLRVRAMGDVMAKNPDEVLRLAVRRMLPKSRLGRKMIKKLHIYADDKHPHRAQKPEPVSL